MFFAAEEAVERKAHERGRQEGIILGRQEARQEWWQEATAAEMLRIIAALECNARERDRQEGAEAERLRTIEALKRNGITLSGKVAVSGYRDGEPQGV